MQSEDKRNGLKPRAFATMMILFTGIGLPVTGIANHLYGLSFLTPARHAWMAAHNVLGLLFVVFSVWHVYLNRHALARHLKAAGEQARGMSREALLAGLAVAAVLLLSVGHGLH